MSCRWFHGLPVVLLFLPFLLKCEPANGTIPQEPESAQGRTQAAQEFTAARLALWQKRLDLEGWKISVLISPAADLRPETLGNIHWDRTAKTAVIRVLDPSGYRLSYGDMLKDMEFTVVHELIHLELSDLPRSDASRDKEEAAVNQLADALLNLDRAGK